VNGKDPARGTNHRALALTGATAGAEAEASWFEALDRPYMFGANTYWRAVILAHLGRRDEAVILLRQAYRDGRGRDVMLTDPNLMPLWGHEQFEQFIALGAGWRTSKWNRCLMCFGQTGGSRNSCARWGWIDARLGEQNIAGRCLPYTLRCLQR